MPLSLRQCRHGSGNWYPWPIGNSRRTRPRGLRPMRPSFYSQHTQAKPTSLELVSPTRKNGLPPCTMTRHLRRRICDGHKANPSLAENSTRNSLSGYRGRRKLRRRSYITPAPAPLHFRFTFHFHCAPMSDTSAHSGKDRTDVRPSVGAIET
jgi:hypothetical protein